MGTILLDPVTLASTLGELLVARAEDGGIAAAPGPTSPQGTQL